MQVNQAGRKVSEQLPIVKHLYQNHSMDTLRWNFFTPRADDIVVATSYKAGTTCRRWLEHGGEI